jgi:hypothetical protein
VIQITSGNMCNVMSLCQLSVFSFCHIHDMHFVVFILDVNRECYVHVRRLEVVQVT